MKIGDMASLLIGGYSVEDLKAIKELESKDPEVITLAKQAGSMSDLQALLELTGQDEAAEEQPEDPAPEDPKQPAESVPEPDYKKLYEAEHKKLSDIQKANVAKDISGNAGESLEDSLIDIFSNM